VQEKLRYGVGVMGRYTTLELVFILKRIKVVSWCCPRFIGRVDDHRVGRFGVFL